jgi:hypothetical protein
MQAVIAAVGSCTCDSAKLIYTAAFVYGRKQ